MGAPGVTPLPIVTGPRVDEGPSPAGERAGDWDNGGDRHAGHYVTATGVQSDALMTTLRQAARLLDFPLGLVSIADCSSLYTLAAVGVAASPSVARDGLPCNEVISTAHAVAMTDLDGPPCPTGAITLTPIGRAIEAPARVPSDYPLLAAAGVRAYLGVPLRGREGSVVGSLCVMDTKPRILTAAQTAMLQAQAEVVEDHLDVQRRRRELHLVLEEDVIEHASGVDDLVTGRTDVTPGRPLGAAPASRRSGGSTGVVAATADLRRGLAAGEVVAYYEPIIDVVTGELHGVEALARWQHPRRGLLLPASFVPLAEDSDLIIDLDLAILGQAARQLRRWQGQRAGLRLNVNLSGRHLAHLECVQRIRDVVTQAGVEPSAVGLEITESALIALTAQATSFVEGLRANGFPIFFDDFGTGWASLSYLLQLPADAVKIDRSFTAALSTRTGNALVRALLGLARELGLDTVVEGVESAADAAMTRELGGHLVQGHFYSPPLPAAALHL
ncbi:MAG: sensor domain-containing phosphodiesterase [Janthinobacterium lividum]